MKKRTQNKANLLDAQMNISSVLTKDYENERLCRLRENKPNQTQFQKGRLCRSTEPCSVLWTPYGGQVSHFRVRSQTQNQRDDLVTKVNVSSHNDSVRIELKSVLTITYEDWPRIRQPERQKQPKCNEHEFGHIWLYLPGCNFWEGQRAYGTLAVKDPFNLSLIHIHHVLNSTDFFCLMRQGCYIIPGYMFQRKLPTTSH